MSISYESNVQSTIACTRAVRPTAACADVPVLRDAARLVCELLHTWGY